MKWFTCVHCKAEKAETEFYNDKQKSSGKKPRCKSCDKLSVNKERRREYEKEYRKQNAERRAQIVRKSMKGNEDHHKAQRQKYLKTESGRSMHRNQTQRRYARMRSAFVESVDVMAIYEEQEGVCYICKATFELSQMECDHVVPLSRGGLHERANCKMACVTCNRSKGAKLLEELSYQVV